MKKYLLCAGLAGLLALTSALARETADERALEGNWLPVKAELGGKPMPEAVLKTISMNLEDGKYKVMADGHPDNGTYTVDASTKPKSMTVVGTDGPNKGKTFPCIYEVKGDSLRICYDLSGTKRPEEFKTTEGTKLYLVTYKRK